MGDRYAKNAGAVFSLKHHIVWCPWLCPARLKALFTEIAAEHGMTLHAVEVVPDHVRLFVEPDPTLCVAEIVNRSKGRTSRVWRQEFASLRSRLPTLWSRSDFAVRVGAVSQNTIRGYIKAQKGR